mmetsp:Transcript_11216/g.14147  ORF Transcript_11216/g.14147 Transcript_11216/m.14147 type:complete len:205 (+) Transcript_11216:64-678(+)|eukprot:CAMPEP_0203674922 /NCGR_PEP_ID=MMETSP0090-20130426/17974_1 /ASSEMBLY_ACC=CAM_ASM_001088 /TAXON_ID=426623 /ORGANISM="Chaetoceros affinis, Strain CCMP159" /LENGTH=204 /DNA_ID=CAMNT_0050540933 /DNA_START=183 /DNA_END=797 /DNA_ORIENTATION=-
MVYSKSVILIVLAALSTSNAFAPSVSVNNRFGVVSQQKPLFLAGEVEGEGVDVDEPAPEDFIVNVGDIDDEPADEDADAAAAPSWAALNERVAEMRSKYRRSEADTGSPEYQVAGMTERISYLTNHLKEHPKDFSTRRGLVALVNKRRRLLNYLAKEDVGRYNDLISSLGVRHKQPSKVQTKEQKYGRFPKQKPNKYANQKAKL